MKRVSFVTAITLVSCTAADPYDGEAVKSDDGKDDASALAVFVDAKFTGKAVVDFSFSDTQTIQDQLLYTVGQLNGMTAVGRVDRATITDVHRTTTADGKTQLEYSAT